MRCCIAVLDALGAELMQRRRGDQGSAEVALDRLREGRRARRARCAARRRRAGCCPTARRKATTPSVRSSESTVLVVHRRRDGRSDQRRGARRTRPALRPGAVRSSSSPAAAETSARRSRRLIDGLATLVQGRGVLAQAEVMLGSAVPTATGSTADARPELRDRRADAAAHRLDASRRRRAASLAASARTPAPAIMSNASIRSCPRAATLVLAGARHGQLHGVDRHRRRERPVQSTSTARRRRRCRRYRQAASKWIFTAKQAATFDVSLFDRERDVRRRRLFGADGMDALPAADVRRRSSRTSSTRRSQRMLAGTGYENRFKTVQGTVADAIQRVVDTNRAAGVRGMVQYALSLPGESSGAQAVGRPERHGRVVRWPARSTTARSTTPTRCLAVGALDSESPRCTTRASISRSAASSTSPSSTALRIPVTDCGRNQHAGKRWTCRARSGCCWRTARGRHRCSIARIQTASSRAGASWWRSFSPASTARRRRR